MPDRPVSLKEKAAEARWTIYVCAVHPDAVRSADSPPPGERPYCPHAKREDPHKMQAVEVVEPVAFLEAAAEDDETVEAVAHTFCTGASTRHTPKHEPADCPALDVYYRQAQTALRALAASQREENR